MRAEYILAIYSSFAFILIRKRELVALLLVSYGCLLTISVQRLFLTVLWVVLQCVVVVFPNILTFFCVSSSKCRGVVCNV